MSKKTWIVLTIGIIWLGVLTTSAFAPDMVTGSEQDHLSFAPMANWFWGLLATVFLLRATLFSSRNPSDGHDGWMWISIAVSAIWIAVTVISVFAPEAVTGSDPTRIPVAAILAPVVGVVLTKHVCEFLASGFAKMNNNYPGQPT